MECVLWFTYYVVLGIYADDISLISCKLSLKEGCKAINIVNMEMVVECEMVTECKGQNMGWLHSYRFYPSYIIQNLN